MPETKEPADLVKPIMDNLVSQLCEAADSINYDRDSFISTFAKMFETISEMTTFENYKR